MKGKQRLRKRLLSSAVVRLHVKLKSVDFIKDEEMPRTGTGKTLRRKLRERYGTWRQKK